ncbi:MAG: hypothetical protein EPN55_08660 [Gammaproteobacteria bacterium]|nr:MAG: hypothetical protein EPN55_08660 [Gammaproteobacteria bacterium]
MSNNASAAANDKDGRLMGILSIAASPGAVLVSPAVFSLLGFFLALLGLTVAHPKQRILSIAGIALALIGGGIGYFFHTQIV